MSVCRSATKADVECVFEKAICYISTRTILGAGSSRVCTAHECIKLIMTLHDAAQINIISISISNSIGMQHRIRNSSIHCPLKTESKLISGVSIW